MITCSLVKVVAPVGGAINLAEYPPPLLPPKNPDFQIL